MRIVFPFTEACDACGEEFKLGDQVEMFAGNMLCPDCGDEVYAQQEAEKQEAIIYGDPDYERYLLSEDYESDIRMEKWEWLKREHG